MRSHNCQIQKDAAGPTRSRPFFDWSPTRWLETMPAREDDFDERSCRPSPNAGDHIFGTLTSPAGFSMLWTKHMSRSESPRAIAISSENLGKPIRRKTFVPFPSVSGDSIPLHKTLPVVPTGVKGIAQNGLGSCLPVGRAGDK